jgi:membrane-bound lytic murein transglycosylase F
MKVLTRFLPASAPVALLLGASVLLVSCGGGREEAGSLASIIERGTLVVLTRNAPTTYYEGRDGLTGVEYDMVTAFAEQLGVRVRFEVRDTIAEILAGLERGDGDVAAAGLTLTRARERTFLPGPTYQVVRQQVVCRRGGPSPEDVEDLAGIDLVVVAESSYLERLKKLKEEHPDLVWKVSNDLDTEQLLERVWREKIDATVADSNILAINRRYYPELVSAFHLSEPESLVWYFPSQAVALRDSVGAWFEEFREAGLLDQALEKYYGFVEIFDYVDTRRFVRKVEEDLPRFKRLFVEAAQKHDLSWTLLAAQAYQESHWNPHAQSPTGVRGIMMLTQPTAREVGVENRLDPSQSIRGGARYLSRLEGRIPERIEDPDRTWFTLAAYNVGYAHLRDARRLAERLGKNPDRWSDVSEVLPLLSRRQYYRTLPHGYARGSEPVQYVNRIRDYRDMLERVAE